MDFCQAKKTRVLAHCEYHYRHSEDLDAETCRCEPLEDPSRRLLYLEQFAGADIMQEALHQQQHIKESHAATLDCNLQLQVWNLKLQLHAESGSTSRAHKKGKFAGDITRTLTLKLFSLSFEWR